MASEIVRFATQGRRAKGPHDLTRQEMRVLELLPNGLTNCDIARELGVSRETVKTHIRHVLCKLQVADRAEAAIRLQRGLTAELLHLFDRAHAEKGTEQHADLGDWLPCRMLVIDDGVEEIWCALSVRAANGAGVSSVVRDLLFAALETHVAPAVFEGRNDWPSGLVEWFEVVRLGIR